MIENPLTFEQLPKAVSMLTKEVSQLRSLLIEKQCDQPNKDQQEKLLTVPEAAQFLNLSIPTIYSKVSKGELPVMKRTKRLYFSSIELMNYLKIGRRKTNLEIKEEAGKYLNQ